MTATLISLITNVTMITTELLKAILFIDTRAEKISKRPFFKHQSEMHKKSMINEES